ncbi:glycerophosphodiester phosphodiesterase [Foetidibacter luteolus]|uniref:glycerophosphodiester phosphodiesterase n=1 Tax=Foetidibacter luteolus TaxID=2608880 RepID=UPI00129A6996|nr:glycerophosphodiester phosphodiesterase [Foetidibacter luteolus]
MKNKVAFLLGLMAISCSARINPAFAPLGGNAAFDKQGHRGCCGLMPENTITGYLKAIDIGVTTLEMDGVISKDKQVLMSHEPFFNHDITTKPDGSFVTEGEEKQLNIYRMDYAEVRLYDVGLKPHPRFPEQLKVKAVKPLLRNVIDSVEAYTASKRLKPVLYNIETKCSPAGDGVYHPAPAEFVELLMAVVKEKKIEDRVIIQSFDPRSLQYLHEHYPAIKTALLVENFDKKTFALQLKDLGFIPTIYSPAHELVTPLLVKQCHDAGIKIIPWTVNDAARIKELKALGVDGIISDYPNLFGKR